MSSAAGIVLQGAKAAGVSFWSALDSQIVGDVLDTRFGTVWGIRMLVWLGFGAVLLGSLSRGPQAGAAAGVGGRDRARAAARSTRSGSRCSRCRWASS